MAVSLAPFDYTKHSHSSRRYKEKRDQGGFPDLAHTPPGKPSRSGKSSVKSPPHLLRKIPIKSRHSSITVDHPVHTLMAELRHNSKAIDPLNEWWAGHLSVSLQRQSATEVNTAGALERVGVFRCDGHGNVLAPNPVKKGDLVCPPIPLRSFIYWPKSRLDQTSPLAPKCMTASIDAYTLAKDVDKYGCGDRTSNASTRITLWELPSMHVAMTSLVNQWKEQLHNSTDTHFSYGCFEREYSCSCAISKKQLINDSICNMASLFKFDKPIDARKKTRDQHPLHPISGFEAATFLTSCAHELRNPKTGEPEGIIFVSELVQHMLRSYENVDYRSSFNVVANVAYNGSGAPHITLHATRDISRGEILAAVFEKGVERLNPYARGRRYTVSRIISPTTLRYLENSTNVTLVTACKFLRAACVQPKHLDLPESVIYAHATDAILALMTSDLTPSAHFKKHIESLLGELLSTLAIPENQVGNITTVNRRCREGRALAYWARLLCDYITSKNG